MRESEKRRRKSRKREPIVSSVDLPILGLNIRFEVECLRCLKGLGQNNLERLPSMGVWWAKLRESLDTGVHTYRNGEGELEGGGEVGKGRGENVVNE